MAEGKRLDLENMSKRIPKRPPLGQIKRESEIDEPILLNGDCPSNLENGKIRSKDGICRSAVEGSSITLSFGDLEQQDPTIAGLGSVAEIAKKTRKSEKSVIRLCWISHEKHMLCVRICCIMKNGSTQNYYTALHSDVGASNGRYSISFFFD
ncbi:hypothetical protein DINM_005892 [Dirofilaria immitis]|nr:hypothetical protein [Dirofilaria immitis]